MANGFKQVEQQREEPRVIEVPFWAVLLMIQVGIPLGHVFWLAESALVRSLFSWMAS